jgi:glycosyltransferase involved in cell wall biosynthesis
MSVLSVVVPCYNEAEVLPETAYRLGRLVDRLVASGIIDDASAIYFVDDGSTDATWSLIEHFSAESSRFHGIKLSRNQGHQNAMLAGILTAPGDMLVTIDADLQIDENAIEAMIEHYDRGSDIVYGVRLARNDDSWFKRTTAQGYYRFLRLAHVEIIFNHADFRLLSRRAVEALGQYGETNLFLRGIVPQIGLASSIVNYQQKPRFAGVSKYPLRKMLNLAIDGITSFSTVPLHAVTILGLLTSLVSGALGLWALVTGLFSANTVPGWASTVIPMYFLGGINLLGIGLIGEYIGKIYLETKRRPRYFIEKMSGPGASSRVAVEHHETPPYGDVIRVAKGRWAGRMDGRTIPATDGDDRPPSPSRTRPLPVPHPTAALSQGSLSRPTDL